MSRLAGRGALRGLGALRGIAAVLVLVGHTSPQMGLHLGKLYLAVDFFFMLSGYIMARTYEARMHQGRDIDFLVARVKRLWPTMAIGTLLMIPLLNHFQFSHIFFVLGLLSIPALFGRLVFPLNGPAW